MVDFPRISVDNFCRREVRHGDKSVDFGTRLGTTRPIVHNSVTAGADAQRQDDEIAQLSS